MNKFRNLIDEENQDRSAALFAIPGTATIKAYSIVINSFLQALPMGIKGSKAITDELVNDISSLDKNISLTESIQSDHQESTNINETQPEIPVISKAQGMVHHLKHTHTKNSIS